MLIRWDPSLETGHKIIDEQHKAMFTRLGDLLAATTRNAKQEEFEAFLDFLENYSKSHMDCEESLMDALGYPERDKQQHKADHARFGVMYRHLRGEYNKSDGSFLVLVRISNWLTEWLCDHIMRVDRTLVDFMRDAGALGCPMPNPPATLESLNR